MIIIEVLQSSVGLVITRLTGLSFVLIAAPANIGTASATANVRATTTIHKPERLFLNIFCSFHFCENINIG